MPTYRISIPITVTIPVVTTANCNVRALDIALASVNQYMHNWKRRIGPTADIKIEEIPDDCPLTGEMVARGDPTYTLEEYSRICEESYKKHKD